ncbi:PadR family transcriptional regulator [Asticcacaulis solisilvae]|uniref:PadR family transcriptional regulator n=1 Tax=Asticcacaulis solisilvae TaxID=1217274 RepID=UPI003FD7F426
MKGFFHHRHHHDPRHMGHRDGFGRGPFGRFGNLFEGASFEGNPFERGRGGRGRDGRGFGHGGLRLVILKLLAEKTSHGYELIKEIEERFNGAYTPSPGVIYPTLSWLEDEGYITVLRGDDGRKQAEITDAGRAHLTEKAEEVERLFSMMSQERAEHGDYAPLFRAMHNLKAALRSRGMRPLGKTEIEAIVDMIDDLAKKIERS